MFPFAETVIASGAISKGEPQSAKGCLAQAARNSDSRLSAYFRSIIVVVIIRSEIGIIPHGSSFQNQAVDIQPMIHHNACMPKRSSTKPKLPDPNQMAFAIVQGITGEPPATVDVAPADDGKNPAAVALGKLGGKKGGAARAKALSKKQRSAIAKKAAKARWGK